RWIGCVEGAVGYIGVQVRRAAREANRIFGYEPVKTWGVVPRPIVLQPGPIVLSPRVVEGVAGHASTEAVRTERLVGVTRRHRAVRVGERDGATQNIGKEITDAIPVRTGQVLVDAEAGQKVGNDRGSIQLLHRSGPVVEKAGLRGIDVLAGSSPLRLVLEARGDVTADGLEPVARIPRVGIRAVAGEVAVQVIGQRGVAERELAVSTIIGRGHSIGDARSGP